MTFLAANPIGEPALTAARSMSPVEICGIANLSQMKVACVPLPAPGAPSNMSLMDVSHIWFVGYGAGNCGLRAGRKLAQE
jgi:hypothetical protein